MGSMLIMLVPMILIFYFMLIRPENKRKKEAEQMRSSMTRSFSALAAATAVSLVDSAHLHSSIRT